MKKIILGIALLFILSGCIVDPYSVNYGYIYSNYTGRYFGCGYIDGRVEYQYNHYSFLINGQEIYVDAQTYRMYNTGDYICF
jgi:hypothetical protein